jgi:DnaK suppressor protein
MNAKDLSELKKMLVEKKNDLLKTVKGKQEKDMQEPDVGDEVDAAGDSEEKELIFGLSDNEKVMLNSIDVALKKIDAGKYGLCESCSAKIPVERLKAMPYAHYCMNCQPKFDKQK